MEPIIDKEALAQQLHTAILSGSDIEPILENGTRIHHSLINSVIGGKTPWHCAAFVRNMRAARLLNISGARVDVSDTEGCTPLHFAVGCIKLMALLLEAKANPNSADNQGNTPLHLAGQQQDVKGAQLLVHHGASYIKNKKGEYPTLSWLSEVELERFRKKSDAVREQKREESGASAVTRARNETRRKLQEYYEHVREIAHTHSPRKVGTDVWTGDVLVYVEGSVLAVWMRSDVFDEMCTTKSDQTVHDTYCKNCTYHPNKGDNK